MIKYTDDWCLQRVLVFCCTFWKFSMFTNKPKHGSSFAWVHNEMITAKCDFVISSPESLLNNHWRFDLRMIRVSLLKLFKNIFSISNKRKLKKGETDSKAKVRKKVSYVMRHYPLKSSLNHNLIKILISLKYHSWNHRIFKEIDRTRSGIPWKT